MHLGSGDDVEGKRQKGVADKDGGCVIESLVHGRPSAAQVVIVHCRQVVVDKGVAVHELEGGARHQRAGTIDIKESSGLGDEERAQPLASVEGRMTHGRKKARRPIYAPMPQAVGS